MMSALKVAVFMGSLREGRNGERVLKMVLNELLNYEVTVLDARELEGMGFPLLKKPLHFYKEDSLSEAPAELRRLNEKVKEADAFVFITAEYNATCPPGLFNLIDHFPLKSFAFKPSSIIAYSVGPFGGIRAATALRSVLSEIGTISSQAQCIIPSVTTALSADGTPIEKVKKKVESVIKYLEWYAEAIRDKKAKTGLPE
ncbi:quinone reductase-like [Lineus longissimus]|uniref:quinone reductase-like n=1 Tax=Lineus longissimus TaxID=88925 RepID=UPI002B4CAC3B